VIEWNNSVERRADLAHPSSHMKSNLLLATAAAASALLPAASLLAEQVIPPAGYQPQRSVLAGEFAEPSEKIVGELNQFPKSFNYLLDNNVSSKQVTELMYLTLFNTNEIDLSFEPLVADKMTISDDKLTFTVHISDKATWSDGTPITAADVAWTFEAIMKPENLTGAAKVAYAEFDSVKAVDEKTVVFHAKRVHWRNVVGVATFYPLPKHWWEKQEFNKVNFEFPVVSGPYKITQLNEPSFVRMGKRDDFWAKDDPSFENLFNFKEIEFRFYPEDELSFEALKKGEFDFYSIYTSHMWVEGTKGERFDKNWIVKQAVSNHDPAGFQGWAFNMRKDKFKDIRVREAIAHCVNRVEFNETLMFNQYFLQKSYWEEIWGPENPCPNPVVDFNLEKARQLLTDAGWVTNPATGIREKNGEAFHITFLERDGSSSRFLIPFQEVLKDVGIGMKIDRKDWSQWTKDMDNYNFEMTWAAWAGTVWQDPEDMWHSKWVDTPSGNNVTGFNDPEVDKLIESQREEFDASKRREILRKIDERIAKQFPYVLLWNRNAHRMLYWNKFGTPPHVLGNILREDGAKIYWWTDPDQEADLKSAMEQNLPLPAKPARVNFDEVFTGTSAVKTQPVQ